MKKQNLSKLIIAVATSATLFISAGAVIDTAIEQSNELSTAANVSSAEVTSEDDDFVTPEPYSSRPNSASLSKGSVSKNGSAWMLHDLGFNNVTFPTPPSETASAQTTYIYIQQGQSTSSADTLSKITTKFTPFLSPVDDNWYWTEEDPYRNDSLNIPGVTDPSDLWVYMGGSTTIYSGDLQVGKLELNATNPKATFTNELITSSEYTSDFSLDLGTSESVQGVRLLDASGNEVSDALTYDASTMKGTIDITGLKYSTDYTYQLEISHTDIASTPQVVTQEFSFTTEEISPSKPTTDGAASLSVDSSNVAFNEKTGDITVSASYTADIKTEMEYEEQGELADSLPTDLTSVSIVDRNDGDKVLATQEIDPAVNQTGNGKIEGTFDEIKLPGKKSVKLALQFTYAGGEKTYVDASTEQAEFTTPSRGSAKIVPYVHLETDEDSEEYLESEWNCSKEGGPKNKYSDTTKEYYTHAYIRTRVELVGYYEEYNDITEYDIPEITSASLISYTDDAQVNYVTNAELSDERITTYYNDVLLEAANSSTYEPGDRIAAYDTFNLNTAPSVAGVANKALTPNTTYDLRFKLESDSDREEQQSFVGETSTGTFTTPDIGGYEPSVTNLGITEGTLKLKEDGTFIYNNKFEFDLDAQIEDQYTMDGGASMYGQSNIQTLELEIFDSTGTSMYTEDLTDLIEPGKTHYVTQNAVEILEPSSTFSYEVSGTYLTHPYDDPTAVETASFTSGKISKQVDGLGKEEFNPEEDITIDTTNTNATLTSFKTSFTIKNSVADSNYDSYKVSSINIYDTEGNEVPSENITWTFETPLADIDLASGELYENTISFTIAGLEPGTNVLDYTIKINTDSNNALVNLTDAELDELGLSGVVDYDELRREFANSYTYELGELLSYTDGVVTNGESGWELVGDDGTSVISATKPEISIDFTYEELIQDDSEIGVDVIDPKTDLMNVTFRLNVEDPSGMFEIGGTSDPLSDASIPVVNFDDYFKLYTGDEEYSTALGNLSIAVDSTPVGDESYLITLKNVYGNQTLDSFTVDYISYDQEYSDVVDSHTYSITEGQAINGSLELPDIQETDNGRPEIKYGLPDSAKFNVTANSTSDVKLNYDIEANPTVTLKNEPDYLYIKVGKKGEFKSSSPSNRSSELVKIELDDDLNGSFDLTTIYNFEKKEKYEVKLLSYGFEDTDETVAITDGSILEFKIPSNFPWWIIILLLIITAGVAAFLIWFFLFKDNEGGSTNGAKAIGVKDVAKGTVTIITDATEDFEKAVEGRVLVGTQNDSTNKLAFTFAKGEMDETLIILTGINNDSPITKLTFEADRAANEKLTAKYEKDLAKWNEDKEKAKEEEKEFTTEKPSKPELAKDIKVSGTVDTTILKEFDETKAPKTLAAAEEAVKSTQREVDTHKSTIKVADKVIAKNESAAKVKKATTVKKDAETKLATAEAKLIIAKDFVKDIKANGTATARKL